MLRSGVWRGIFAAAPPLCCAREDLAGPGVLAKPIANKAGVTTWRTPARQNLGTPTLPLPRVEKPWNKQ